MRAFLGSLRALNFPRVRMSAEGPNFRLENGNYMAIENILLKATGRVSFCSPPLLPSLYERLSPKPRQVELSKVDGLDRTVLPPKFLSTWNL